MKIFSAEEPLRETLLASQSFAFASAVDAVCPPQGIMMRTPQTDDLFYTRSIYVSTGANENGDFFEPKEVWRARNTTVDKPTNIEHDPTRIVGHITSSWALNANMEVVDPNLDEPPPQFHLANGAVIYRHWSNPELKAQADTLIDDIENGRMFVSMECLFSDFDYVVEDAAGAQFVVARNEDTAFLTKHLKVYGGTGTFQERRLFRLLRDILFSGKGYVKRPANKNSVIFLSGGVDKGSTFASGVDIPDKETVEMSQELESKLATANEEIEKLKGDLAKVNDAKACMCNQYEAAVKLNDELKAALKAIQDQVKSEARVNAFLEKGFSPDEAKAKAAEFTSLDDETFNRVISLVRATEVPAEPQLAPEQTNAADLNIETETGDSEAKKFEQLCAQASEYFQTKWEKK